MQLGEIIKLGEHRLACGDATDPELVSKLIGEDKVRCVATDPPYGVAYIENKVNFNLTLGMRKLSMPRQIHGDEMQTEEHYADFTTQWLNQVKPFLSEKNSIYIFNSDWMICALRQGMKKADIYYSQMIIWVKNAMVMGRKDYNPQHELIAYGWYGRHKFERVKDKSVIFQARPRKSRLHPTMKPVQLMRKLLLNSSKVNDFIYDPFGGSGSTLIACEQTKRKCLMIEIDPFYCDTIIKRWERYTNKHAITG